MPQNDRCHVCSQPADRIVGRVNEPVRNLCGPCYQNFKTGRTPAPAGRTDVNETEIERPLSNEEMVEELLEMRENLS